MEPGSLGGAFCLEERQWTRGNSSQIPFSSMNVTKQFILGYIQNLTE